MMNSSPLFHFSEDNYKCVHISSTDASVENFVGSMVEFIEKQREQGVRGVTLTLTASQCELIPLALKKLPSMRFHNTDQSNTIMLEKWLLEGERRFPLFCQHKVMAGGLVFSLKSGRILLMQGRNSTEPAWKLPGGGVDPHEYVKQGAVREVKEETGVECKALAILGSRQSHKALFDVRSVYFIVLCSAQNEDINIIDEEETLQADWFPLHQIFQDLKLQQTFGVVADFLKKVMQKYSLTQGSELFQVLKNKYVSREQTYAAESSSEEQVFRSPQI